MVERIDSPAKYIIDGIREGYKYSCSCGEIYFTPEDSISCRKCIKYGVDNDTVYILRVFPTTGAVYRSIYWSPAMVAGIRAHLALEELV